jgi:molybdopterin molybdotransferase
MIGLLLHTRNSKVNTRQFLGLDEALTLLRSIVSPVDGAAESIPLADAAGRVTAETIVAPMDVPPFFASAMDGYAICGSDPIFEGKPPYLLPVQGESRAGTPFADVLRANHAVRIFTGAVMPERCDTVVIQEHVQRHNANIELQARPNMQTNVRPPGHDIGSGAILVTAGLQLGAFDLAWLTACGLTSVQVRPRIRLALFSTGDELRSAGDALRPGQIYDANRFVLQQLLRDAPVDIEDLGILPDDPQVIEATLKEAAARHDVVMTSGGVSVGDADYVRDIVERLGRIEFWKIAIKPGKPLAYGRIGHCHFFGLPGNPVSTIVTFLMLVKPILATLAGAQSELPLKVEAKLSCDIAHEPGRVEYQRGAYSIGTHGISVQPTSDQSSNRIGSFRGANCLIEVPRFSANVARGTSISILPLTGLLGW